MGDSDDEYDRRRARDKFRRERSDYQEHRGEDRSRRDDYGVERRDMWARDRGRRDYRDVDPRRRERFSPGPSAPIKKMRRDWDDRGYGAYDAGYAGGSALLAHQSWASYGPEMTSSGAHAHGSYGVATGHGAEVRGASFREGESYPSQPPLMTFKQFLASQDDAIGDEEAVRKYNDYKLEFKRQQLNKFFLAHKDEEWFKMKYQPEESNKRRHEHLLSLNRRVAAFLELMKGGWMDRVTVDGDKADEIIRLLDAVVIKLEGGTESDLKVLDEPASTEEEKGKNISWPTGKDEIKKKEVQESAIAPKDDAEGSGSATAQTQHEVKDEASKSVELASGTGDGNADDKKGKVAKKSKGKFSSEEENDDSGSESEKGGDDDTAGQRSLESSSNEEEKTEDGFNQPPSTKGGGDVRSEVKDAVDAISEDGSTVEKRVEVTCKPDVPAPRALHKTCSIFLRNLAPTITKLEVEAMCRRFPGFLRVAIADPQPERRFFRRGWVTFDRNVNIKDICWNLNNIRLRDCELGAIVNRDLARRIRSCSGIALHKQVVRADIKHSAKLVQMLDTRNDLWVANDKAEKENGQLSFALMSRNPLLKNITDYLIEEASAEEEELLGMSSDDLKRDGEGSDVTIERDEALLKVLDRLLLYLRIVHSVDYYNHSDYPNEDEMPNRCGIMHARGPPPLNKVNQNDISDYMNNFEAKLTNFLQPIGKLLDDEAVKLGKKDPVAEVEKFVAANTQELGKDKWLCPLSGKKFKGPEFVRKHIFNKHGEKIEEVKKEVEYFNNYLLDAKRPQLPEHPGNRPARESGLVREGYGVQGSGYVGHNPYSSYGQNARVQAPYSSGYANRGRENYSDSYRNTGNAAAGSTYFNSKQRGTGRNRGDPREIVGYHDLDAPEDLDVF